MQLWTYIWETDDGQSLGPICTSSEAAMDAAFEEWKSHEGGNLGWYEEGTREEFDKFYSHTHKLWVAPLEGGLQFVIDAIEKRAAELDTEMHRMMLECWSDTVEEDHAIPLLTDEQIDESWSRAYQRRCEGPGWDSETNEPIPGLSSEDYQTMDESEGFDGGVGMALGVIRDLAGIDQPTEEVAA